MMPFNTIQPYEPNVPKPTKTETIKKQRHRYNARKLFDEQYKPLNIDVADYQMSEDDQFLININGKNTLLTVLNTFWELDRATDYETAKDGPMVAAVKVKCVRVKCEPVDEINTQPVIVSQRATNV
jgi:hypothetical protein